MIRVKGHSIEVEESYAKLVGIILKKRIEKFKIERPTFNENKYLENIGYKTWNELIVCKEIQEKIKTKTNKVCSSKDKYLNEEFSKEIYQMYELIKRDYSFNNGDYFNKKEYGEDIKEIISKYKKGNKIKVSNILLSEKEHRICPYCNRQFVNSIRVKENKIQSDIEFDHVFPRKHFPEYSISIYNLLCVCKTCNHNKSEKYDLDYQPYIFKDFSSEERKIIIKRKSNEEDGDYISISSIQKSEILIENPTKMNENIYLKEIYQEHIDEIKDVFDRYRKFYTKSQMREYGFFGTTNALDRYIFSIPSSSSSEDERYEFFSKNILSKMRYDLVQQLKGNEDNGE